MFAFAASASAHAIEYHHRELLAMKYVLDQPSRNRIVNADHSISHLVASVVDAARNELTTKATNDTTVPEHFRRFPWFAMVVHFAVAHLQPVTDVNQLQCTNALLEAMPAGVRVYEFGRLLHNLALRIEPPTLTSTLSTVDRYARVNVLLTLVRSALTVDINDDDADERVALSVRAYDAIADELRWLVVPRVVRRHFRCTNTHTTSTSTSATVSQPTVCACAPSLAEALVGACAPDELATMSTQHRTLMTCARLVVLLFDCVEHYLRVGGVRFVRCAAVALLYGSDNAEESTLHLFADLLRASIALVRNREEPVIFHSTASSGRSTERIVVFRADGDSWYVNETDTLAGIGADCDQRWLRADAVSQQQAGCSWRLFNALRQFDNVEIETKRRDVTSTDDDDSRTASFEAMTSNETQA